MSHIAWATPDTDQNSAPTFSSSTKILAPDGTTYDNFGVSVDMSDDRVIVGAYRKTETNEYDKGRAYLFSTDGSFVCEMEAPDYWNADSFGSSVSISPSAVVVGAYRDARASGSVYIFSPTCEFVTKVSAPDRFKKGAFGYSLAVSEEYILVGAPKDDVFGVNSGSAYLFTISGEFVTKLVAPYAHVNAGFGWSVAMNDDLIVIGANRDETEGGMTGSAYIYTLDGDFITKIVPSDAKSLEQFGFSVAVSGDTIAVGAVWDNENGNAGGSAYIYSSEGTLVKKILASDGEEFAFFGVSVAVCGDLVAVGAEGYDKYTGAVYLFSTDGDFVEKVIAPDAVSGESFGVDVAMSGGKLVVGAYTDDENGNDSGASHIFV